MTTATDIPVSTPTDAHRLGIKLFVENSSAIEKITDFTPVFHSWIQTKALDDLLVDVADYSHVPEGPGILLVAHEANYAMDAGGNRLGLYYARKRPLEGSFEQRLRAALRATLVAAEKLEQEPSLAGRLRFRTDELLFRINDRLLAPNATATFAAVRPRLESVLTDVFGAKPAGIEHNADAEVCFEVRVTLPKSEPIGQLLARL
ncbi:MAG: hypothetical protein ACREIT_00960 [Tepidisphaeraceae bacterium]